MKKLAQFVALGLLLAAARPLVADEQSADAAQHAANSTAAAAVVATSQPPARAPDLLEHLVDSVLQAFNVRTSENTVTHYVIAALFLVGAVLLRRVVTNIIFHYLKKLAAKTETTLDDKLFPAMEQPTATFIMVTGIFSALKVLKLSTKTATMVFLIHGMNAATPICFSRAISCAWSRMALMARSRPQKTTSEKATVEPAAR